MAAKGNEDVTPRPDPNALGSLSTLASDPSAAKLALGTAANPHDLIGHNLGAYRIESKLGAGAMGDVYLGVHAKLGRPVAIKTLKPAIAADASLVQRFFAEARAVNVIRHENIVECTDLVTDDVGRSYMVMEYLEGQDLGALISAEGKLEWRRAVHIAMQVSDAIAAAHDKDIIHRDVKPENVFLIARRASQDYVKILDFGIARLKPEHGGASATQTGVTIGTPAYMSPEQVRGTRVGPGADIYSLGAMLFEMLTGRLPFTGSSTADVMLGHISKPAPEVAGFVQVPEALSTLVTQMLAKTPEERPPSLTEVRARLRALVSGDTDVVDPQDETAAPPGQEDASATADAPPVPSNKRLLGLLAMGATVLAIVGGIGAFALFQDDNNQTDKQPSQLTPTATETAPPRQPSPKELRATIDLALSANGHPAVGRCGAQSAAELQLMLSATNELRSGLAGSDRPSDGAALNSLQRSSGTSAEHHYALARARLYTGDFSGAAAAAEKAHTKCAAFPGALGVHGSALLRAKEFAEAVPLLTRATELAPNYGAARYNLALAQIGTEAFPTAIVTLDSLIAGTPSFPGAHALRGKLHLMRKSWDAGILDLEKAVAIDAGDAPARSALVKVLRHLGRDADAAKYEASQ